MFGILSENFSKRYELMPEQLQGVFDGPETAGVIEQVAAVNNLSSEQLEIVTCLTGDVLAGFIDYKDFSKKLTEEFKFDAILAQDIFKEIDRQVFLPVRDLLKQVYRPEGAEEKKVEKQGTAGLLQKLGQPLDVARGKPLNTIEVKPLESIVNKPIISETEEKEFKVAPANVIDLSQKSVESKIGFQANFNANQVKSVESKPIETKSFGATQDKPVFPFFKVNSINQSTPGMIMGKEQVVKPTLEVSKPMDFSFGEVRPPKEKLVSDVEIQGGFGVAEKIQKPNIPMEKSSFFGKIGKIVASENINTQPIKVVNFAAPIPPPPAIPKEEKITPSEIKTPFISVNSPLTKNINEVLKPQNNIPPVNLPEKPIIPNLNQELPKLEIKQDTKEEIMPQVPPENVVNLKKLKF